HITHKSRQGGPVYHYDYQGPENHGNGEKDTSQ
ncbi:unnamed protein product, partial [marine sediment metagenome]